MRQPPSMLACAAVTMLVSCVHAPGVPAAPSSERAPAPVADLPVVRHRPFTELAPVDPGLLRFEVSPEELSSSCAALEKAADGRLAAIVALAPSERVFANTFHAYEEALADYTDGAVRLAFLKNVHPDEKVRAAAGACEERSGKYLVQVNARVDLYRALKGYTEGRGKTEALTPADRRLIFLASREFRRNGMELGDADRAKLVQERSRLAELASKFERNLDEDASGIEVTPAELSGLPQEFIARLKRAPSGKLFVSTKYPDYFPVMQNARNPDVRHRMELAFQSRAAGTNDPLLVEALGLRARSAQLLGFPSFVDFVTENRMAKNAQTVHDFLTRLRGELTPGRDRLNRRMEALKAREEHVAKPQLNSWDWRYYLNEIRKKDFALDDEKIRAYFPTDKVLKGLFEVYATLLNVTFALVPNAPVWAKGVQLYEVRDGADGRPLARFYMDTFPRQGKYGHAACFPLSVGREVSNGYLFPTSALVANFDPGHFDVEELETLFHEFGHVMHSSLTTAPYASLSGTNVALDFVEAPSQMLENWVYQPAVLKLISVDPEAPGLPMPAGVAKRVALARTFDAGVRYMRQDYLASLDEYLHTHPAPPNVRAVEVPMREAFSGYHSDPREDLPASFGHLMSGYEGGYYGYLWSEVFAADMFTRFEEQGLLNPVAGKAYRDTILANGQLEDADVLIEKFLGRAPNEQAFLRLMGVAMPTPAK